MVDCTDRHFRWAMRQLAPRVWLYTEMISSASLIHGTPSRFLDFLPEEHPVVLQLAGNNPEELRITAAMGSAWGYDEINLNCGCPSDKVQNANYGACLMAQPLLVHQLVKGMIQGSAGRPVTVKHRIGIKGRETYEHMREFALAVMEAGASRLIIHARIAILEGLNPKENRNIPPLRYEDVARLKAEFPQWPIEINGGIRDLNTLASLYEAFDGVMVGRQAYDQPYFMAEAERLLVGGPLPPSRAEFLRRLADYFEPFEEAGEHWHHLLRHFSGLFHGLRGARTWRRLISPPWPKLQIRQLVQRALDTLPTESLESSLPVRATSNLDPVSGRI